MEEQIKEILGEYVDFAEWATDDNECFNAILHLIKEREGKLEKRIGELRNYAMRSKEYGAGFWRALEEIELAIKEDSK